MKKFLMVMGAIFVFLIIVFSVLFGVYTRVTTVLYGE